jgi:hypothetical protein
MDATTDNETAHCRRYADTCRSAALRQFRADLSAACGGCAFSARGKKLFLSLSAGGEFTLELTQQPGVLRDG